MERYIYASTISAGAYGVVYQCLDSETGLYVAAKGIRLAHQDAEIMRLTLREVKILKLLPPHPNIVKLLEAFRSKSGRVYLVFEFVERSLHQELDRHPSGALPGSMLKSVAWQLLHALAHCHDHKVVHRDLKPANVLLSGYTPGVGGGGVAKLCDFGFARLLPGGVGGGGGALHAEDICAAAVGGGGGSAADAVAAAAAVQYGSHQPGLRGDDLGRMSSYVMTRWYRPPEVLVGDLYGPAIDIWSLGCTIAELATGRPLFPGQSTADQLWLIMRCMGPLTRAQMTRTLKNPVLAPLARSTPVRSRSLRQRLPGVPSDLFELIAACLVLDPHQRPTARELLQMPYFRDIPRLLAGSDLVRQLPYAADVICTITGPAAQQHRTSLAACTAGAPANGVKGGNNCGGGVSGADSHGVCGTGGSRNGGNTTRPAAAELAVGSPTTVPAATAVRKAAAAAAPTAEATAPVAVAAVVQAFTVQLGHSSAALAFAGNVPPPALPSQAQSVRPSPPPAAPGPIVLLSSPQPLPPPSTPRSASVSYAAPELGAAAVVDAVGSVASTVAAAAADLFEAAGGAGGASGPGVVGSGLETGNAVTMRDLSGIVGQEDVMADSMTWGSDMKGSGRGLAQTSGGGGDGDGDGDGSATAACTRMLSPYTRMVAVGAGSGDHPAGVPVVVAMPQRDGGGGCGGGRGTANGMAGMYGNTYGSTKKAPDDLARGFDVAEHGRPAAPLAVIRSSAGWPIRNLVSHVRHFVRGGTERTGSSVSSAHGGLRQQLQCDSADLSYAASLPSRNVALGATPASPPYELPHKLPCVSSPTGAPLLGCTAGPAMPHVRPPGVSFFAHVFGVQHTASSRCFSVEGSSRDHAEAPPPQSPTAFSLGDGAFTCTFRWLSRHSQGHNEVHGGASPVNSVSGTGLGSAAAASPTVTAIPAAAAVMGPTPLGPIQGEGICGGGGADGTAYAAELGGFGKGVGNGGESGVQALRRLTPHGTLGRRAGGLTRAFRQLPPPLPTEEPSLQPQQQLQQHNQMPVTGLFCRPRSGGGASTGGFSSFGCGESRCGSDQDPAAAKVLGNRAVMAAAATATTDATAATSCCAGGAAPWRRAVALAGPPAARPITLPEVMRLDKPYETSGAAGRSVNAPALGTVPWASGSLISDVEGGDGDGGGDRDSHRGTCRSAEYLSARCHGTGSTDAIAAAAASSTWARFDELRSDGRGTAVADAADSLPGVSNAAAASFESSERRGFTQRAFCADHAAAATYGTAAASTTTAPVETAIKAPAAAATAAGSAALATAALASSADSAAAALQLALAVPFGPRGVPAGFGPGHSRRRSRLGNMQPLVLTAAAVAAVVPASDGGQSDGGGGGLAPRSQLLRVESAGSRWDEAVHCTGLLSSSCAGWQSATTPGSYLANSSQAAGLDFIGGAGGGGGVVVVGDPSCVPRTCRLYGSTTIATLLSAISSATLAPVPILEVDGEVDEARSGGGLDLGQPAAAAAGGPAGGGMQRQLAGGNRLASRTVLHGDAQSCACGAVAIASAGAAETGSTLPAGELAILQRPKPDTSEEASAAGGAGEVQLTAAASHTAVAAETLPPLQQQSPSSPFLQRNTDPRAGVGRGLLTFLGHCFGR